MSKFAKLFEVGNSQLLATKVSDEEGVGIEMTVQYGELGNLSITIRHKTEELRDEVFSTLLTQEKAEDIHAHLIQQASEFLEEA